MKPHILTEIVTFVSERSGYRVRNQVMHWDSWLAGLASVVTLHQDGAEIGCVFRDPETALFLAQRPHEDRALTFQTGREAIYHVLEGADPLS